MAYIYNIPAPRPCPQPQGWIFKNLPSAPGGIIVTQNLSDDQLVSDILSKNLEVFKVDAEILADGITKTIFKYISDDGGRLTDFITISRIKSLIDAQNQTDGFSKVLSARLSDGQIAADEITKALNKFLSDTEQLSDFLTASVVKSLGLTDAQSQIDSLNKTLSTRQSDEQAVADGVAKTISKFLSDDGERLTDLLSASILKSLRLSDAQSQTDGISKILGNYIAEGISSSDAISKILNKMIVGDGITQADSALYTKLIVIAVIDSIQAQDSISQIISKSISESAVVTETFSKILKAIVSDGGGIWDDAVATTVIVPSGVAASFIESILSEVRDVSMHAAGVQDLQKRVTEIVDAARGKAGLKGLKR